MVNISQHKMIQKTELSNTNIKLQMAKQMFSEDFSKMLYSFSKEHCAETLKSFRQSWQTWASTHEIKQKINSEIYKMRTNNFMGTDDEITQKIYTSARFYYRKKEKKEKKEGKGKGKGKGKGEGEGEGEGEGDCEVEVEGKGEGESECQQIQYKTKKPYIGFSQEFIQLMDNEIRDIILGIAQPNTVIKLNQRTAFNQFTQNHIDDIDKEFGLLKVKYDELLENFIAKDIANKLKKAYQNRFYSICKLLNNM